MFRLIVLAAVLVENVIVRAANPNKSPLEAVLVFAMRLVGQQEAGKITGAVCAPKRSYFSCPGTKTDMTRPAFVKGHCFASCKWTSMWCPSTSKCVVYGGEKVCFYPQ
ncbi:hypothetical protein FOZ60_013164 [Perkinsus olseni]|uniref:Secreted protein n=1 Tax=Perkinsus olseni TaxID=32597 RepID=A0A7J6P8R0_PEROL|nr:hypothetical protein FOZ60_013164 [Perkinsus olseni]